MEAAQEAREEALLALGFGVVPAWVGVKRREEVRRIRERLERRAILRSFFARAPSCEGMVQT